MLVRARLLKRADTITPAWPGFTRYSEQSHAPSPSFADEDNLMLRA